MDPIENEFELRFITPKELRVVPPAEAGKPATMTGYAAVFNSPSEDLGGFREIIAPGAFTDALASGEDIRALRNHDDDKLLGRTSSNTLRLSQDDHGLKFDLDLPDTSYARDLIALHSRGDVRGMSFGFRVPKGGDSWAKAPGGGAVRTVSKAKLGEVSVVDNPAYSQTSVSMRGKCVDKETLAALEEFRQAEQKSQIHPELLKRRMAYRQIVSA